MKTYKIQGSLISDWPTFHNHCKSVMDFPAHYGQNMNAWIDCVDDLTSELTLIEIVDGDQLRERVPEILSDILECAAFVNFRKTEIGEPPTLMISMA